MSVLETKIILAAMRLNDVIENFEKSTGQKLELPDQKFYGEPSIKEQVEKLRAAIKDAGMTRC